MGWGIPLALMLIFLPSPKPGFPVNLDGGFVYSPAVADVDGDGRKEIISTAGGLWLIDCDGNTVENWPVLSGAILNSKAAVGNAVGEGNLEIACGQAYWLNDSIRTFLFDMHGNLLPGWPVTIGWVTIRTRLGVPSFVDVDLDGYDEILVPSSFGPHIIRGDGELLLPNNGNPGLLGGDILTANLNGDPELELIVLTDPIKLINLQGDILKEFSSGLDTLFMGLLADLDDDHKLDIVLLGESQGQLTLTALDIEGEILQGWPLRTGISSIYFVPCGLSAGDIDGDARPEVIFTATDIMRGIVYAAKADGAPLNSGAPLFRASGFPGQALVVSLNGKRQSILVQFCETDNILRIYAFDCHGAIERGWPISLTPCFCNNRSLTPAVADLEGDGRSDLVALSPNGVLFAYEISNRPPMGDWLQENHDSKNTFTLNECFKGANDSAEEQLTHSTLFWKCENLPPGLHRFFCINGREVDYHPENLPRGLYIGLNKKGTIVKMLKLNR